VHSSPSEVSDVNPIDPTGALTELSTALTSEMDMSEILDRVVHLVQKYVPGAEQSSITLIRGTKAATAASTGPLPIALDEIQYGQGYGPCLDAGRSDAVMHIADMATEQRWPAYTPLAIQHGVRSSLSLPLPVENYLVGALNIYATRADAFDHDSIALGTSLAAHVSAALSVAETSQGHRLRADNLAKAMRSRDVIEQAKGMIMAQQKCSAEAAFQLLRKLSMDENIKLQDLAVSVVSSASGHPVRLPESE
jgi:transcriptional regulator with GAF, ATPase, and Fis domain